MQNELFVGLLAQYIELKEQEEELKSKLDTIKTQFEELNMSGTIYNNKQLVRQERNTININDNIKDFLKEKGVFEACVTPDKKKINAMVKAKILSKDEVSRYEEYNTGYAWTLKDIEESKGE